MFPNKVVILVNPDGLLVQMVCCHAGGRLPEHRPGLHLQLQLVGTGVHQVPRQNTLASQGKWGWVMMTTTTTMMVMTTVHLVEESLGRGDYQIKKFPYGKKHV